MRRIRLLHRLSMRLMLAVGLLTALLFVLVSAVTWRLHSKHLNDEVVRHAALLSETMLLSLRDAMHENRFNVVDSDWVTRIQRKPGIAGSDLRQIGTGCVSTDESESRGVPLYT